MSSLISRAIQNESPVSNSLLFFSIYLLKELPKIAENVFSRPEDQNNVRRTRSIQKSGSNTVQNHKWKT